MMKIAFMGMINDYDNCFIFESISFLKMIKRYFFKNMFCALGFYHTYSKSFVATQPAVLFLFCFLHFS